MVKVILGILEGVAVLRNGDSDSKYRESDSAYPWTLFESCGEMMTFMPLPCV